MTAELQALSVAPGDVDAEKGFVQCMADSGLNCVARALAVEDIRRNPALQNDQAFNEWKNLPDTKPPGLRQRVEPVDVASRKAILAWMDELSAKGNIQALRDEAKGWRDLAQQCAASGRDRLALHSYNEFLGRLFRLRATDPWSLPDYSLKFDASVLSPAVQVFENLANLRRENRDPFQQFQPYLEPRLVNAWMADRSALPEDAPAPMRVFVAELPCKTALLVPERKQSPILLLQPDWSKLNEDAVVLSCGISLEGWKETRLLRGCAVAERVVLEEVSLTQPREGVPWISYDSAHGQAINGRFIIGTMTQELREVLNGEAPQPEHAQTLAFSIPAQDQQGPVRSTGTILVKFALKSGKTRPGLTVDPLSYFETGCFAMLKRDFATAETEFKELEVYTKQKPPPKFTADLLALLNARLQEEQHR